MLVDVVCMGLQNNVSRCLHGTLGRTLGEMESRMLRELELMGINYLGIVDSQPQNRRIGRTNNGTNMSSKVLCSELSEFQQQTETLLVLQQK